ncbi:hypothetical protein KKC63_02985 [Patescibacteria group bacterium]|nr:hypothetical protein [Patescibacteria group bacterium]MBU4023226.1 hypothetical protein [Patescibacteria group bacterium]MBU4078140.1 hypothetical protein [Patescibacteria group bacterium]
MGNKDIDNYISKVRNNICNIYNGFYLWRSLQNAEYNEIYNRNKYFWGIVLDNLRDGWLLGLAKLFEENKKEVISIPFLLKFTPKGQGKKEIMRKIRGQKAIVENLWKWRCKILAHQDRAVTDNPQSFYRQYPVKGIDIENLLATTEEIFGMVKSAIINRSEAYTFKNFKEGAERDAEQIIRQLK